MKMGFLDRNVECDGTGNRIERSVFKTAPTINRLLDVSCTRPDHATHLPGRRTLRTSEARLDMNYHHNNSSVNK